MDGRDRENAQCGEGTLAGGSRDWSHPATDTFTEYQMPSRGTVMRHLAVDVSIFAILSALAHVSLLRL